MIEQAKQLLANIGRAGLAAKYPNDFEYYAITLELVNSKGKTVEFLTFPVNPKSIDYNSQPLTNVKQTLGGVTVLDSESFVPRKYVITGTFGRKFRLLLSDMSRTQSAKGYFSDDKSVKTNVFNAKFKTGYGSIKVLESIKEKSTKLDDYGQPHLLFLYNPSLNHNYLVKINAFQLRQDESQSNMMWHYTLNMTTIAPIDRIILENKKSLKTATSMRVLNQSINQLTNSIRNLQW